MRHPPRSKGALVAALLCLLVSWGFADQDDQHNPFGVRLHELRSVWR